MARGNDRCDAEGGSNGAVLDLVVERARGSETKEAYQLVSTDVAHRIGVFVSLGEDGTENWSVELLICFLDESQNLDLSILEKALDLCRELRKKGYAIDELDAGWISLERTLPRSQVSGECRALMKRAGEFRKGAEEMAEAQRYWGHGK